MEQQPAVLTPEILNLVREGAQRWKWLDVDQALPHFKLAKAHKTETKKLEVAAPAEASLTSMDLKEVAEACQGKVSPMHVWALV
eukprot:2491022-Karenia_brevis.AAC.1